MNKLLSIIIGISMFGQQTAFAAVQCTESTNSVPTFADVSESDPHAPAISWAATFDVVEGYSDGTFKPDQSVNRAEFLKIILGSQQSEFSQDQFFPDVPTNAWFAPYVNVGKELGIIQGYPDGTFKPEQTVNLAEGLKMAYMAHGIVTETAGGTWYDSYFSHARQNNILFSADSQPGDLLTREDVVWIAWRLSLLPQDIETLKANATAGDVDAQFLLGIAYESGEGIEQDLAEAAKWYRKAAEQGDIDAQFLLGVLYETGEGVTQDFVEAAKWYRLAEAQGDCEASEQLQILEDDGLIQ